MDSLVVRLLLGVLGSLAEVRVDRIVELSLHAAHDVHRLLRVWLPCRFREHLLVALALQACARDALVLLVGQARLVLGCCVLASWWHLLILEHILAWCKALRGDVMLDSASDRCAIS